MKTNPYPALIRQARRLLADRRGANAIECGLIAAGFVIAVAVAVHALSDDLVAVIHDFATILEGPAG